MNDMKKDTYTLWIDDEMVATRDHTREGYNDLLAYAQESLADSPEIYSSKDDKAVWSADSETTIEEPDTGAAEYWDSVCEDYEPNCYDGTYSEM
jgi:hypothetical protein